MAQSTEAACLLETGVLYGARVLLQGEIDDPIFAGLKAGAFSLYFGDSPIYHFDLEGRWQRAFVERIHYLKALDGTVQAIDRVREGVNMVLVRRKLSYAEAGDLDERVRRTLIELAADLDAGRLTRQDPTSRGRALPSPELRAFLETAAAWDADAWFRDREKYLDTYGPIPLLPPDCLNAVVLQATLGHAHGLAFGGTTPAEHYVRSPDEFEAHAAAVAALYGRRTDQCKNVFLAGSDVLTRPAADVAAYLESVARHFPVKPSAAARRPDVDGAPQSLDGIHAFLDVVPAPPLRADDAAHWASLGLKKVTLGLESGDPAVRSLYGRRGDNDAFLAAVSALKGAGLGVGVMLLGGAGGLENADRHVDASAALLESSGLSAGDLVTVVDGSALREPGGASAVEPLSITPLDAAGLAGQVDAFKRRLAALRTSRKVKFAPYSPGKQADY